MIIASVVGLMIGVIVGLILDVSYPGAYSFYITMGLLAAMDSVLGALRSYLEGKYNNIVFISGFIVNAVLAGLLVYLGDRLGVPLYYAVILVFGGRMFLNLAALRHIFIDRYLSKENAVKFSVASLKRVPKHEDKAEAPANEAVAPAPEAPANAPVAPAPEAGAEVPEFRAEPLQSGSKPLETRAEPLEPGSAETQAASSDETR